MCIAPTNLAAAAEAQYKSQVSDLAYLKMKINKNKYIFFTSGERHSQSCSWRLQRRPGKNSQKSVT